MGRKSKKAQRFAQMRGSYFKDYVKDQDVTGSKKSSFLLDGLESAAESAQERVELHGLPEDDNLPEAKPITDLKVQIAKREQRQLEAKNEQLKEEIALRVKRLQSGESTSKPFKIAPQQVRVYEWTNRDADAFRRADFAQLRQEIQDAGGNFVPVVLKKEGEHWYLVCGRRRMQACKELGLEVSAVELGGEYSDDEIFTIMHAENHDRSEPSIYEVGVSLAKFNSSREAKSQEALSIRQMQKIARLSHTSVRLALFLAQGLPEVVLRSFENRTAISVGMAQALKNAMEADGDAVIKRARQIWDETQEAGYAASKAVKMLCHEGGEDGSEVRELVAGKDQKPFARLKKDTKGRYQISFEQGFKRDHIKQIQDLAARLASENKALVQALQIKPKKKAKASAQPPADKPQALTPEQALIDAVAQQQ